MAVGMCVPSNCSVTDFVTFKPFIIEALNNIMISLFDDIKGFDPNTQLSISDLSFDESNKLNGEVTQMSGGGVIVLLIILFFTLTTIVSTIVLWYRRK